MPKEIAKVSGRIVDRLLVAPTLLLDFLVPAVMQINKTYRLMKYLMVVLCWCIIESCHAQTAALSSVLDSLQEGDTLYVNFCVSHSEFGSSHDGIFVYKNNNTFFGKHVLYNYGVSVESNRLIRIHPNVKPVALEVDSIIAFYNKIKTNYFIMKKDWKLDEQQVQYLKDYFSELEKFESMGFSNSPDFYTVMSMKQKFVVLDKAGDWDKFLEVRKGMRLYQEFVAPD